jgi:hypothetical protein
LVAVPAMAGETLMSPFEIKLILHWHCVVDRFPHDTAPIYAPTMANMIADGLIAPREDEPKLYTTTERGSKFVEMLCETPLPESHWLDPRFTK